MLARFCRYIDKVFDFGQMVAAVGDSRLKPRIPCRAIWLSAVAMFATAGRSLNALDPLLRMPKRLEAMIGPIKPSVDTIGEVFSLMDPEVFRGFLSKINHQLGRNKVLVNEWPLRFAAIDGHEFFSRQEPLLLGV
jgi:hypothetical protein